MLILTEETDTASVKYQPKSTRERKVEVALDGEASTGCGQHHMKGEIPKVDD